MSRINKIALISGATSGQRSRSDLIKQIIVQKFLGYMFDSKFGIANFLKIPTTGSIDEFAKLFKPYAERAIRIALKLDSNAPLPLV